MIQLTLTLKMTTTQVAVTSVTVNNNNPIQNYIHPNDHTQPTNEMTPGFKPFTVICLLAVLFIPSFNVFSRYFYVSLNLGAVPTV